MPEVGRVLIAESDGPWVVSPTWTRYDQLDGCALSGYDIHRGRQTEFDVTTTGSARVYFSDRASQFLDESVVGLQVMDPHSPRCRDRRRCNVHSRP